MIFSILKKRREYEMACHNSTFKILFPYRTLGLYPHPASSPAADWFVIGNSSHPFNCSRPHLSNCDHKWIHHQKMLPAHLDAIVQDLQRDVNVTARLKRTFRLSPAELPRAHRLQLSKSVLSVASNRRKNSAHDAFLEAIACLRSLAPFLKSKGQSTLHTVAAVEKYSVNHASFLCFSEDTNAAKSLQSAKALASDSLRVLLEARTTSKRGPTGRAFVAKAQASPSAKENVDPRVADADTISQHMLDMLLFDGASRHGIDFFLPRDDSASVAVVACGALVVSFAAITPKTSLKHLLMLAKSVVVPWIDFLKSCDCESDVQYSQNHTVYLKRVQHCLLKSARVDQSDSSLVFKARSFAISLGDVKLSQYARDLLRSALCVTRGKSACRSKEWKPFDVVGNVYDEALKFVSKYEMTDRRWFSEDVSAWLDHVALVWSRRSAKKSIPFVFAKRVSALRKGNDRIGIVQICELQLRLIKANAYDGSSFFETRHQDSRFDLRCCTILEEELPKIEVPNLDEFTRKSLLQDYLPTSLQEAEDNAMNRLRFLRVLEPIRKVIVTAIPEAKVVPTGVHLLLEFYIAALVESLYCLAVAHREFGERGDKEIVTRLDKMTVAGIESAKEVTRLYFRSQEQEKIWVAGRCVEQLLEIHAEDTISSAQTLWTWISGFVHGRLQLSLANAKSLPRAQNREQVLFISSVAERWCGKRFPSRKEISSCKPGRLEFLEVTRVCHGYLRDRFNSAKSSLEILSLLLESNIEHGHEFSKEKLHTASNSFVHDLLLVTEDKEVGNLCQNANISPYFLHTAVVGYFCMVRRESPWMLPNRRKRHDPLVQLHKASQAVLLSLSTKAELCPVRRLYNIWVSFCTDGNSLPNRPNVGTLRRLIRTISKSTQCSGHPTIDEFISDESGAVCTPAHISFCSNLANVMICMSEGRMSTLSKMLVTVQELLAVNKISEDLELMHVCSEITQWIGTLLSAEDCDPCASLAYAIANECRAKLGIPAKLDLSVLSYCRQLGSLGYRMESLVQEDVEAFQSPRRDVDILCFESGKLCKENSVIGQSISSDFCGLQKAVDSLHSASKDLKSSLMQLMTSSKVMKNVLSPSLFTVAGVNVDVGYDCRSESGQTRFAEVLVVIDKLYRFARLLLAAENLSDGRYYFEKCLSLAALCLPESNFFRASISAVKLLPSLSHNALVAGDENVDVLEYLEDAQRQLRHSSDRNLVSASVAAQTVALVGLEVLSDRWTSPLDNENGSRLIALNEYAEEMIRESEQKLERSQLQLTFAEVELISALTHAYMQDNETAANILTSVVHDNGNVFWHTRASALYFLARIKLMRMGGLKCAVTGRKDQDQLQSQGASKRMTRSRTRRKYQTPASARKDLEEVSSLLGRACNCFPSLFPSAQLYRRVWSMYGMLQNFEDAIALSLSHSIGYTFNLRWGSILAGKNLGNPPPHVTNSPQNVEKLNATFKSMSISSPRSMFHDVDLRNLVFHLKREKSVILGLNVDESHSAMVAWRISPNGVLSKRFLLPAEGPSSVAGVSDRLSHVTKSMKERSVTAGQSLSQTEKQEWWDHRFSLDADVKNIVSDIESKWLQDFQTVLVPSIFDADFLRSSSSCVEQLSSATFEQISGQVFSGLVQDSSVEEEDEALVDRGRLPAGVELGQLILVLDSSLERIPWESLPILRRLQVSVTRAPSLKFLSHQLNYPSGVADASSVFYVINPAGDLQRTEQKFKDVVKSQPWNGFFGKVSKEIVAAGFGNEKIYLYCGHGAGDQFLSPRKFAKTGEAPIALLMGCSSARPENTHVADCESNGPAIDYLIHGSPAVVGNLWDVSDKDIDRFTSSVLTLWLGVDTGENPAHRKAVNLAEAVSMSRAACRLPYLVGAAAVVIGSPNVKVQNRSGS